MNQARTYLDHNATAPLRPEARAAMLAARDVLGNPSSVHADGRRARALVETAREEVAALVGAQLADVVFTSGATEACNAVLHNSWRAVYLSRLEHPAVLAPALASTARIVETPSRPDGRFDADAFAAALDDARGEPGPALLALQAANNETGVLQPLTEAAALARSHGLAVFTDAVQAGGKIDCTGLDADFIALSAHKLGGPAGVGALIVRAPHSLPAFILGGGQERRRRGGTENVAGIAGFGAAAAAARRGLREFAGLARLRDRLERELCATTRDACVIGADSPRLPNTSLIALPGRRAETLVIQLDLAGISVSAGAACSSGKVGTSETLAAIRVPADLARAAIRVSLGPTTTERDIDAFLSAWAEITHSMPQAVAV
jgi:cysteine desulfurase